MSVAVGPKLYNLIERDGPDDRSRGVANSAVWAARKPADLRGQWPLGAH